MDKDLYKAYFDFERNHWWFRARREILKSYIQNNVHVQSQQIANIGVATGASTIMLRQFGNVESLEYEKSCIDYVKDKVDFPITHGSILELPYSNETFDLACAFDVIEHVEDDSLAVRELMRVCRPGGSVLVTVPAHMYLWGDHDEISHHFRRYSKKSLEKVFSIAGGEIVFCSYFNSLLYPLIAPVRVLSNSIKSKKSGRQVKSDLEKFNPGIFNDLLFNIMNLEKSVISKQSHFFTGVSLLLHWKKFES